jgi:hypothetical protein
MDPQGRFRLCLVCGRLTFAFNAVIDSATRRSYRTGQFHQACWKEWQRSEEMTEVALTLFPPAAQGPCAPADVAAAQVRGPCTFS